MNVYESCPQFSSQRFLLRQTSTEDCDDLLKVYSDVKSVPIFNSDNCTGDFYITTREDMLRTIAFWQMEYGYRYYVRWSIIDRASNCAIGTIELFHRCAEDYFNHVGLLRLDLRSDYETEEDITAILSLIIPPAWELFDCPAIATKVPECADVRIRTLQRMGFRYTPERVHGRNGITYGDYYILRK